MMCGKSVPVILIALGLLVPRFSPAGQAQDGTGTAVSKKTFTISGRAGVGGVVMKGLPGNPIADEKGSYTVAVPYGWSGKIVPDKEGYSFTPVFRQYSKVAHDLPDEDYTAEVRMVTISNRLLARNETVAEARVRAQPGDYTALTDPFGRYTIRVPYGWSGRLAVETGDGVREIAVFANLTHDHLDGKPVASSGWLASLASRRAVPPRVMLPYPAGNVFVIPTAQTVPQKIAETADDLRVMLHILREAVTEPRTIRGAFVDFGSFFDERIRVLEAFYLQGSAAVFVLEMDASFSLAPESSSESDVGPEAVDPVWQRARQKLYAPDAALRGPPGMPGETQRLDFQQFKEDLLTALRHAANLRHVEPNESVILTITAREESAGWPGSPASAGSSFSSRGGMWFEGGSYSTSSGAFGSSGGTSQADSRTYSRGSAAGQSRPGPRPSGAPATPGTVLTIQAKKADIDAFAQGNLPFEQFQQRVNTFTY